MSDTELLTSEEAAARLGISRQSLHNLTSTDPDFPPPAKRFGRTPLWSPADLDAWRERHPARKKRGS